MEEHLEDCSGARKTFAGKYFCYNLIYYEYYTNIEAAIGREKYLKGLTRKKKEELIAFFNPDWRFFTDVIEREKGDLPLWTLDMEDNRPW